MPAALEVPIVIVGFGHSDDVVKCLNAIATQRRCPKFEVYICENGGPAAFDELVRTLTQNGAPCEGELRGKVGDGVNQAADLISATASIPSLNFIPLTTFGNWF
jgi:GT2 family glycosyltransferase